jgi:hypothetical protein
MTTRSLALALSLAACSNTSSNPAEPDAGIDAPASFQEAFDGDAPQLVDLGGGVLQAPKVQPIFFAGDDAMQAQTEQFLTQLAASDYWTTTTSEYGVGALTVLPTIVLTDTPPTTDAALQALLAGKLTAPDQSTIYSVFTPEGVVIDAGGDKSCQDFGAYHDEAATTAGAGIVYALVPRCNDPGVPEIDELTVSTSHELIEAATDPFVEMTPAFGDSDPEHYVWAVTPAAEVGDYCEYVDTAYDKLVGDFMVQRIWSNAAAKAGHDPCVPAAPGPYIGAEPMMTESTTIDGFSGSVATKGVVIPVGMSKTIDVVLYSDDPNAGDFTVHADFIGQSVDSPTELSFTWDKTTGHNGDHLQLTIKRVKAGSLPGSEFVIEAQDASMTTHSLWWSYAN